MTDREILDEIYNRLQEGKNLIGGYAVLADFIEQEWQREDERVQLAMYNRNRPVEERAKSYDEMLERERQKADEEEKDRPDLEQIVEPDVSTFDGKPIKKWYIDAREMERHRGLEIGEDGTVKGLK